VKDVVHRTHTVERRFRAVPIGSRATFIDLPIPRVECQDWGVVRDELHHRMIVAETDETVTLRQDGGAERTFRRADMGRRCGRTVCR
jgi:hypothetical protein